MSRETARDQGNAFGPTGGLRRRLIRFLPLILPAAAIGLLFASGFTRFLSLDMLVEHRDMLAGFVSRHYFPSIALFFLVFATTAALGVPGGPALTMTGGFLFGGLIGAGVSLCAVSLGGTLFFLFARSSFGYGLTHRPWPLVQKLRAGFHENAVSYLLFLRLTPAFPFFVINLAMALTNIRPFTFLWVTFVGVLPATLTYGLAGAGIDAVLTMQKQGFAACLASGQADCRMHVEPHQLVTPQMILALVSLGLLALAPILLRRLTQGRQSARQTVPLGRPTDRS
ncbi:MULTISPECIES: VTT domain-containing protein [unclassified Beijerinckia]|uniref:TVP38/TMEM64 family protein n=1 Tax=unclassified Beijerinckia TaxID=2638183 RepID=UPI000899EE0D|nr:MULTISPECIES: VTT domain-containing protein [unclassified Beijerinckia]MDH7796788.1 putative membrane protein YdjX (TVP38/TMEM64 family) [Beijerinckia sp. GAS462]SEC59817.1 Uncharacterized membrane protein YdjX, TVP38/TMEM64 family, SNARE-associated domain [Beijerinckia sp. 28-YEA-48]